MDRFTTSDGKVVGFKGDMDKLAEALLRLSKYEDTGLLPEEVAAIREEVTALRGKVERQKFDTYCLMIALKGENAVLKAKSEKAKQEILDLKKQIEFLTIALEKKENSNLERFLESLNRSINCSEVHFAVTPVDTPDPAANPTTKKKIAWEAD